MDYKKQLHALEKNQILLHYTTDTTQLPIDASHFGGNPYLPPDFSWPYFEGTDYNDETKSRPLSFLMQLNLEELHAFDTDQSFPPKGMLYFFYEYITMPWGFDPKDRGCARVYYFEDTTGFTETSAPADIDESCIFPTLAITFSNKKSIPDYAELEEYHIPPMPWEDFLEKTTAAGYPVSEEMEEATLLLGYGNIIQSPMPMECELVTNGIYCGGGELSLTEAEQEAYHEKSRDWVLLCQISTVTNGKDFELMFGDCGALYFYVREQDLEQRCFDGVWQILQCF